MFLHADSEDSEQTGRMRTVQCWFFRAASQIFEPSHEKRDLNGVLDPVNVRAQQMKRTRDEASSTSIYCVCEQQRLW